MKPTLRLLVFLLANSVAAFAIGSQDAITREIPWDGSETLTIDVPADVRFVQTPGPGKVTVTGPRRSVESFSAQGGILKDGKLRTGAPLQIVVTAPKITRFSANGDDTLTIEGFAQSELHLELTGRADVKVAGRTDVATLHLQGFGWADLSQLESQGADVALTGSRKAILAPTAWAKVSGQGAVVLLTNPAQLTTDLRAAGRIIHAHRRPPQNGVSFAPRTE